MAGKGVFGLFAISMIVIFLSVGKSEAKNEDIKCGICFALVDEISISFRSVDPKKTINVGSYRIDTNGNQAKKNIPYLRSRSHISDFYEMFCEKMGQWVVAHHNVKKRRSLIRKYNLNNKNPESSTVKLMPEFAVQLHSMCQEFIEDHEDDSVPVLMEVFEDEKDLKQELCVETLDICKHSDVDLQKDVQTMSIRESILGSANLGNIADPLNLSPGDPTGDDDDNDGDDAEDDTDNKNENVKKSETKSEKKEEL